MSIYKIIEQIAQTASTNEKLAILKSHVTNEVLKKCFEYAYNPRFNFWIRYPHIPSTNGKNDIGPCTFEVLDRLITRKVTGDEARAEFQTLIESLTFPAAAVACRILHHDLRCGASDTLASKVWPKLVPEYPVMLASKMDEKAVKHLSKFESKPNAFVVQTKMDGGRLLAKVDETGSVTYMSRNGSSLNLFEAFDKDLSQFKGQVLDGELIVKTSTGKPDRKTGNGFYTKAVRDTLTEAEAKKFTYVVWDIVPETEYLAGAGTESYTARLAKLMKAHLSAKVEVVESETAQTIDECLVFYQTMRDRGEEGAVIKVATAVWEDARSKNMVKLKNISTGDFLCVGVEPGQGKYANMIGALKCETSCKTIQFSVGTGLTDEDRQKDPTNYIGNIVEVKYNEIITAKGRSTKSLFLPVFVTVRWDKKTANSFNELS